MFTITHAFGRMESDPSPGALAALVAELDSADEEHSDVSVSDESGWTLSAHRNGRVVWENVEDDEVEPRHLDGVGAKELLTIFERLASGDVPWVEALSWNAGY